jgi:hypothetical protein
MNASFLYLVLLKMENQFLFKNTITNTIYKAKRVKHIASQLYNLTFSRLDSKAILTIL